MKKPGRRRLAGKYAFTLLEILVVLGIMSLLGSIGFSGIQAVRNYIHNGKKQALLKEIQTACRLYYMDHAGWPNVLSAPEVEISGGEQWHEQFLAPYMETDLTHEFLEELLSDNRFFVVVDLDQDHWIRREDFSFLESSARPLELWERSAAYCVDPSGKLLLCSWK